MLEDAIGWLGSLSRAEALDAFWHLLLFEVPRYFLSALAVAAVAMGRTLRPPAPSAPRNPIRPTVTVLLPGHNEADGLARTVESLRRQSLPPSQIVVVDDGSTDGMWEEARRLRREGRIDLALRSQLRCGKSAAANFGLRYATGDYVVIGDIDTDFAPDAIERMYEGFDRPAVGGVAGNLRARNPLDSVVTAVQDVQYMISISVGRVFADAFDILFIVSGAVGMFRRDALQGVAGWEVGPGEDADLTMKLRRAGWKIAFAPSAIAYTDVPTGMVQLIRQRLRWNRSLVRIRLDKFGVAMSVGERRFSLSDALGHIDILFSQAILPFSFLIYLIWLAAIYGAAAVPILFAVALIYVAFALASFLLAVLVTRDWASLRLLPYVPAYSIVSGYVLRFVRLWAVADELIARGSFKDPYVPQRVLDEARKDQS